MSTRFNIWVRREACEQGNYVDAEGNRFLVQWCSTVLAKGKTPADFGYEQHESVEMAAVAWGLTEYVDPASEEELLTETENNEQE